MRPRRSPASRAWPSRRATTRPATPAPTPSWSPRSPEARPSGPQAGINLADRRSTGFRWYAAAVTGHGGRIGSTGSRSVFFPEGQGLTAVVVVGYLRTGLVDPYEYRVELPAGARLNLEQYEFLM